MSPPNRANRSSIILALAALAAIPVACPSVAEGGAARTTDVPRYAQRRVYRAKPGPRLVIVALPNISWRDLREADAPNLHKLIQNGAIGLMPVAEPQGQDPNRTWVTLGAGRATVGGPPIPAVYHLPAGGLEVEIARVVAANEDGESRAQPGLLGSLLREAGLKTAVVHMSERNCAFSVLMDSAGGVDDSWCIESTPDALLIGDQPESRGCLHARDTLAALVKYDAVVLDLSWVGMRFAMANPGGLVPLASSPALPPVLHADRVVGAILRQWEDKGTLIALMCPQAPYEDDPVTHKSLGPVVLYDTKHPQRGLLYSTRTRWPGFITAADFAPTVLTWWQIEGSSPGVPMAVRPGRPDDLDRLDRTLSDHFRWGFTAVPIHMGYGAALIVVGLLAVFKRRRWLPYLQVPALALPLVPVGFLLSHLAGTANLASFLALGLAFAFSLAYVTSRLRVVELALSAAMLAGVVVIAADTLTGNWLVRTAAYTPPPLIGARYYGLSNEHMGFLAGMTTVGLAACWELWSWRGGVVAALGAAMVLLVSAPFWGANWGGGIATAAALLTLWLLAVPQRWSRAVPITALALLVVAFLPGALDVVISPSAHDRTHLGASLVAFFSGNRGVIGDIAGRKLQAGLDILFYTPWTIVLALGTFGALWALLRPRGPVHGELRGKQKLTAGIAAAMTGGLVASVMNDSGVVAGAGFFCAAFSAALFLAARSQKVAV